MPGLDDVVVDDAVPHGVDQVDDRKSRLIHGILEFERNFRIDPALYVKADYICAIFGRFVLVIKSCVV